MTPGLWTPGRAARRLGVRRTLVLRLIRRRDLAAVKVGRVWRIEPEAVDAYIATRRQDVRAADDAPFVDDRQIPLFPPESTAPWPADRLTLADQYDSRGFHTDVEAARGEVEDGPSVAWTSGEVEP